MKILYITTIGGTMCFFTSFIKQLLDEGNTVDIATNEAESPVPNCYREWGCKVFHLSCTRNPLDFRNNFRAIREIHSIVKAGNYDIVHCHTPIAAFCTRIACRKLRKKQTGGLLSKEEEGKKGKKGGLPSGVAEETCSRQSALSGLRVFYTAHGFHFYTGAPLKNWLIFYPIEWICSWWTDVLITINKEDYKRASEHFHAKKTVYIPGVGIDTEKFKPRENGREKIRKELNLRNDTDIMLLSVGELNENKNHEAVIKALAKFSDFTDTDNVLNNLIYVIVGRGELKEHLASLAESLGVKLILTGYRNDVADFYDAADVYVLPSYREGLNVSLMEAMASGLPIACSKIHGNMDLINNISNINNINDVDKEESWQKVCQKSSRCLFDPTDIADIRRAISYAIKNRRLLGEQNLRKIKGFDLSSVQSVINTVYKQHRLRQPYRQQTSATSITEATATAATSVTADSYADGSTAFTDSVTPQPATITLQHDECNECGEYRHLMDLLKWQEKRKEIGVPLTAKLLLSVGELSVRKNHKVVVEALQELPLDYSDYWYVIVGKGPLHDDLLAADHTGRLKLLGYRTDIVELLRASDLFVFPSLQEGLPVALMEAMACGVPCIASRIRGNVDLVTDIDHLFEPTSTTEVLKQITFQHKDKSDDSPYSSSSNSLDNKSDNNSSVHTSDYTAEYIPHNSEQNHIQDYSLKNVTTVMLGIYPPPEK